MNRSVSIALCAFVGLQLEAQSPVQPKVIGRSDIELIIKEYILSHPEVVGEAWRRLQEKGVSDQRRQISERVAVVLPELNSSVSTVTVIAFVDYQCGYCKQLDQILFRVGTQHTAVKVVFHELPILGVKSISAARAALAAEAQGQYERYHRALMDLTEPMSNEVLAREAKRIGLDMAQFDQHWKSRQGEDRLQKDLELSRQLGVDVTPTLIIGNEVIVGIVSEEELAKYIEAAREAQRKRTAVKGK